MTTTLKMCFPKSVVATVIVGISVCRLSGGDFEDRYVSYGSAPEFQTDDLNSNKRSIGANVDYQREPRFESTGRR